MDVFIIEQEKLYFDELTRGTFFLCHLEYQHPQYPQQQFAAMKSLSSSVIRHPSFVIRHSSFVIIAYSNGTVPQWPVRLRL